MKTILINIVKIAIPLYLLICLLFYLLQEKVIFLPEKLDPAFPFSFDGHFEEVYIPVEKDIAIHGLLFKADSSKGLIFYLHGNAGSLRGWGEVEKAYTNLNYDVFILDYRGYGKSGGKIESQKQLFSDGQKAYDEMLKRYDEKDIVVLGYSIGSGMAAKVASDNQPKMLILQAPYYNLTDLVHHIFPILPGFLLKYKLETYKYIQECEMPIVIFHGDADEVIYYGSSLKLKEHLKPTDNLITIQGQQHNGMTYNSEYMKSIEEILKNVDW